VFSPINNYLYVTNSGLNTVIVIDTSNNTVVATIPVRSGPSGIEIVPSIDKIYVASYVNNSITVIDTKTNNINFIENVGKTPIEVIYSPHSKSLYVSLLEDSKVIVINPISNIVTATIPVGQSPWGMTFDLNNHLYVANSVNKSVSVIDTKTNNIKYTIKNIGDRPLDIEFVPSSNMLYIVDFFGDRVWYTSTEFLQIKDIAEQYDQFGSTLAAGDFNNDGYKDLAIGVPEEDVKIGEENRENVGVINVIYGSSLGLTAAKNEIWYQGNNGILETAEQDDRFSNALAAGDFNNNGLDDLAIGVPNENIVNKGTIGIINVIYGTEYGLRSASNQIWYPGNNGILEPQFGSRGFGNALAAGNFGKGNADDLAIGVPTGGLSQGGSINVIYGSPTGLTSTGNQVWYQGYNGIGDRPEISKGFPEGFGWTLAAGNFGKDSTDDLVIGVPGEDNEDEDFYPVSFIDAGMIHVIYGSPTGLTSTGNQILHQGSDNRFFEFYIYSDDRFYILSNDRFGNALAAGDFNNTGFDDLVIGVPGEDQETTTEIATSIKTDSGVVKVSYGSSTGLVLHRNIQLWSQDTS
jgi:YVTN family beta-propeller protein